jgi:hypothetical protein
MHVECAANSALCLFLGERPAASPPPAMLPDAGSAKPAGLRARLPGTAADEYTTVFSAARGEALGR